MSLIADIAIKFRKMLLCSSSGRNFVFLSLFLCSALCLFFYWFLHNRDKCLLIYILIRYCSLISELTLLLNSCKIDFKRVTKFPKRKIRTLHLRRFNTQYSLYVRIIQVGTLSTYITALAIACRKRSLCQVWHRVNVIVFAIKTWPGQVKLGEQSFVAVLFIRGWYVKCRPSRREGLDGRG